MCVRFELAAGDTLVLNVETPHYLMVPAGSVMRSFVFAPRLICGTRDSVFAARYFDPVIGVHALASLVVPEPERTQVARAFDEAFRALAEGASGYEFAVREQLSRIWLVFFGHAAARDDRAHVTDAMHAQDMERIRLMLDFIEGHAAENISLADIAAVADVCERECLRCFQRALGISPMRYVMRWPVMHGAELLVQERALSIAEVARRAGIPSASNFSRLFKRLYGMTPRAWRERASGAGLPPYACGRPEG